MKVKNEFLIEILKVWLFQSALRYPNLFLE